MAKQRESKLQQRIRKVLLKEVGGWWFKVWGGAFQQTGIPDLVGCVDGLFFAFEVKVPKGKTNRKGKASEIQLSTIEDIQKDGGGVALVIFSPDEAVLAVTRRLEKARWVSARRR